MMAKQTEEAKKDLKQTCSTTNLPVVVARDAALDEGRPSSLGRPSLFFNRCTQVIQSPSWGALVNHSEFPAC